MTDSCTSSSGPVSKTTPYATVKLNVADGTLQLPAEFRFEGAEEIFVWREPFGGALTLSVAPPSMSIPELLKSASADNDSLPDFKDFLDKMYPHKLSKRTA